MLTLLFFTVKANCFDTNTPQTSASESGESETEEYTPPGFHISLVDSGVLLGVIAAYSVHKIREKKRQGRL